MLVYFIRHAERIHEGDDLKTPLSPAGIEQAIKLGVTLSGWQHPDVFLSSGAKHALDMVGILRQYLPREHASQVLPVSALTPQTPESQFNWKAMIAETENSIDWAASDVVACVGHEPRLGKLITQLTSKEVDPLRRAEAILIEAKDMQHLLDGRASVGPRILPFSIDNTEEEKEKALQPKIQSKMQVSTFLAGFSFAALIGILTQDGYWQASASPVSRAAAAASLICLTWASALFVAAVYMFDRLAMPRKFWSEEHVKTPKRGANFRRDSTEHGRVYAHMIWTWKYVFSSAVLFAVLGFAALVFHRGIPLLTTVLLMGLAGVFVCYLTTRPQLADD